MLFVVSGFLALLVDRVGMILGVVIDVVRPSRSSRMTTNAPIYSYTAHVDLPILMAFKATMENMTMLSTATETPSKLRIFTQMSHPTGKHGPFKPQKPCSKRPPRMAHG